MSAAQWTDDFEMMDVQQVKTGIESCMNAKPKAEPEPVKPSPKHKKPRKHTARRRPYTEPKRPVPASFRSPEAVAAAVAAAAAAALSVDNSDTVPPVVERKRLAPVPARPRFGAPPSRWRRPCIGKDCANYTQKPEISSVRSCAACLGYWLCSVPGCVRRSESGLMCSHCRNSDSTEGLGYGLPSEYRGPGRLMLTIGVSTNPDNVNAEDESMVNPFDGLEKMRDDWKGDPTRRWRHDRILYRLS